MNWLSIYLAIFGFLIVPQNVYSAHILFYHNIASYSHRVATYPLGDALAKRGHTVTYITPFHNRGPYINPNITEIVPPALEKTMQEFLDASLDINKRIKKSFTRIVHTFYPGAIQACQDMLSSQEYIKWSNKTKKLDLIIMDNCMAECGLAIAYKYKAKHIYFNTVVHLGNEYDQYGFQPESGVIPELEIYPAQTPMTFLERVFNTLISIHFRWVHYEYMKELEVLVRSHVKDPSMPNLDEMGRNASLVLYAGDFVTDYPRSHPPLIVTIPAMICNDGRDQGLPEDLRNFIEDPSSDGFVYISFGSLAISSLLPMEVKQVFFDTVKAFPNLKFLWKWNAEIPEGAPKNLYFKKWFPQVAILAHPNIKGFVTQGGRPSTLEALCNAVPMIAFPVLGDQDVNTNRMARIGGNIRLELSTVTAEELKNAIQKMVYEPEMKQRILQLREILNDRKSDPLDDAIWWVEYVLRHNDSSHLRAASFDQWWFQRRLIDVWAFLFSIILGILILAFWILKSIFVSIIFGVSSGDSPRLAKNADGKRKKRQ